MSERIRGSYDDSLYKSTYTLLYFTLLIYITYTHAPVGRLAGNDTVSINFSVACRKYASYRMSLIHDAISGLVFGCKNV